MADTEQDPQEPFAKQIAEIVSQTAAATAAKVAETTINAAAAAATVSNDVTWIKKEVGEMKTLMVNQESRYVTQTEFRPVRNLAYGLVSAILFTVLAALLALIINHPA